MKIALVWPKGFDPGYAFPFPLGYLKSNLDSSKHTVRIIDCALDDIKAESSTFSDALKEFKPDVVGVSCWCLSYVEGVRALKVAKELNPHVTTVMGGVFMTMYPMKTLEHEHIDFLFRGECELSFPVFLEELKKSKPNWSKVKGLVWRNAKGKIVINPLDRQQDLDKINFPDYDAIRLLDYIKKGYRLNTRHKMNALICLTRGCPYKCEYCSGPLLSGPVVRRHSVQYAVNWVKHLYEDYGIRLINIVDDNFTFHVDYAKEFCREIIALGLKDLHFGTPNGIRVQRTDEELFHLMKKAGWEQLLIAPESGSKKTLKRMNKTLDPAIIPEKVEQIKKAGLKVHAFFMIGYPGESEDDLRRTSKLLRQCKFNFFYLQNFHPLPGTPVFDKLVASGEIEDGLMPRAFADGERTYVPEGLKNFNFAKFVMTEYLYSFFTYPSNIPHMYSLYSPHFFARKLVRNLSNMIKCKLNRTLS